MPIDWQHDSDEDLHRIRMVGRVDDQNFIDFADRFLAEASIEPGTRIISDHRGLEVVASVRLVRAVAARIGSARAGLVDTRIAMIASGLASYGMMRMLQALVEPSGVHVHACRDESSAIAWLRETAAEPGVEGRGVGR